MLNPHAMIVPHWYDKFKENLSKKLLQTWTDQGHYMNGAIIETMEFVVNETDKYIDIIGMINKYGAYIEAGVKKNKIPFSGTGGHGGKSLYIQALARYAQLKMHVSEEESLGVAFAIAYTQKREGMPTKGSYAFTKTGKRTMWIQETLKSNKDLISQFILDNFGTLLGLQIDNMILDKQIQL